MIAGRAIRACASSSLIKARGSSAIKARASDGAINDRDSGSVIKAHDSRQRD
jgi:hypothetical protein